MHRRRSERCDLDHTQLSTQIGLVKSHYIVRVTEGRPANPRELEHAMEGTITAAQLASRWAVTTKALAQWRRDGTGPAYFVVGDRSIRYRAMDIEAFEEARLSDREGTP